MAWYHLQERGAFMFPELCEIFFSYRHIGLFETGAAFFNIARLSVKSDNPSVNTWKKYEYFLYPYKKYDIDERNKNEKKGIRCIEISVVFLVLKFLHETFLHRSL